MRWGVWEGRRLRFTGTVVAENAEEALVEAKRTGVFAPAVQANLQGRIELQVWRSGPPLQYETEGRQA